MSTSAPVTRTSGAVTDADRARGLRRMRLVATGFLVAAAITFVFTRDTDGILGFVNAAAEAGMVGAIADWFAVTALFRHPGGVPIPHTALVPRRKAELGRSLEDFVADNFLVEDVVRERVLAAEPTLRACEWLGDPAHAERATAEVAHLLGRALDRLQPEDVRSVVEDLIIPRLREEPAAEVLGALLAQVVADRSHVGLVDLVVAEALRWLELHEETFVDVVSERAPWWAPQSLNDVVTQRLHLEVVRWLQDIARDPHHHARYALDSLLASVADSLQSDPETQASAERLKLRLLEQPQLVDSGMAVWGVLERTLREALDDPDGPVRERVAGALTAWAHATAADDDARRRMDARAADAVVYAVQRYGSELTSVITTTVDRWDGQEAAERIELHVGRDLQFIRINGTVVGGLVGIVIHAAGILLP